MSRRDCRLTAIAGIVAIIGSGPAFADGQPEPAVSLAITPMTWSGLYVGAHAGYAQSDADWTYTNVNPYSAVSPFDPITAPGVGFSPDGFIVGGQVGGNYQVGQLVVGAEASFTGMNLDTTQVNPGQFLQFLGPLATQFVSTEVSDLLLITGRLGWAWDPHWLAYVKGGYARAEVQTKGFLQNAFGAGYDFNTTQHQDGWALGGGVEYKLHPNVGVAIEYMHVDLGDELHVGDVSSQPAQFDVGHNVDVSLDTVTARLNIYLNEPEPRAALK